MADAVDKGLVVVTGASGFVGKYVIAELLRSGYRVRGTLRAMGKAPGVRAAVASLTGSDPGPRLDLVEADLLNDAHWPQVMAGAMAVMHVAATIVAEEPKDFDVVVKPSLDGTRRVLEAARAAGVRRVVMTSSIATVGYGLGQTSGRRVYTEADFTRFEDMRFTWAYCVGKTRAERFAWDFARANGMELTTIHPGAILGPASDAETSISVGLVSGLLDGTTPAMPNVGFSISDVRDVAALHVKALDTPQSIGERYLVTADYLKFSDVADILRAAYPNYTITNRLVPDWIMRVLARFGGPVRQIINDIGNQKVFDGSKGERLLGRPYISAREAVLASAESVIRLGLLKPKR
jgi:nucleoside-diphosphate-sugar epimerase